MSDFDPTNNRIPFGLLTRCEQDELKAWPHGIEHFTLGGWHSNDSPMWSHDVVYRGKPALVVTSKWFNVYTQGPTPNGKSTRKVADEFANEDRIAVLRIDTCNGVSTVHIEEI